jgi:hypothetical protein
MGVDGSGLGRDEVELGGHHVAWFHHHSRPVTGGTVYTHADGDEDVRDEVVDGDL